MTENSMMSAVVALIGGTTIVALFGRTSDGISVIASVAILFVLLEWFRQTQKPRP